MPQEIRRSFLGVLFWIRSRQGVVKTRAADDKRHLPEVFGLFLEKSEHRMLADFPVSDACRDDDLSLLNRFRRLRHVQNPKPAVTNATLCGRLDGIQTLAKHHGVRLGDTLTERQRRTKRLPRGGGACCASDRQSSQQDEQEDMPDHGSLEFCVPQRSDA